MNQKQFEKEFVNRIHLGKCIKVMRQMPDNCIDTIITDPPYGIRFMGKKWDTFGETSLKHYYKDHSFEKNKRLKEQSAFTTRATAAGSYDFSRNAEFQNWCKKWAKEALRIAKPGAILLCCGGTRTFHRLTCGLEDAGWIIKDCILWLYGSGFPKSLDISKAIDSTKKVDRKVIGSHKIDVGIRSGSMHAGRKSKIVDTPLTVATSDLAKLWDGWGTALKPAFEIILCAEKPLSLKDFTGVIAYRLKDSICQLKSYAKTVEKSSLLNHQGQNVVCPDSVLWNVVEKSNTPEDLLGLMDTLPSGSEIPLSLNIGLLWLNTLAEICLQASTFTTEMVTSLTTDLKILNSLLSKNIPAEVIQVATGQHGIGSNAELVASIFSAARMKLNGIPGVFVQDNVISKAHRSFRGGLVPNWEPIIVAMKPLDGTFANNAEKHGVAGLWIDGGRIDTKAANLLDKGGGKQGKCYQWSQTERKERFYNGSKGRWPANLILDKESAKMLDKQSGAKKSGFMSAGTERLMSENPNKHTYGKWCPDEVRNDTYGDTGGVSRFFYTSKSSKSERERENDHPTVKPLSLMKYLCKLTRTPTGGIVLDPFGGSGTTALACIHTQRRYIIIEKKPEYCQIARERVKKVKTGISVSLQRRGFKGLLDQ